MTSLRGTYVRLAGVGRQWRIGGGPAAGDACRGKYFSLRPTEFRREHGSIRGLCRESRSSYGY